MSNTNLIHAKRQKNDEFYTQLRDIEKEMQAYLDYDLDVFRGKTILLPCDDPTWSNFTKYFALNFERLGLKKLISTSYAADGHGKVFVLDGENELQWEYLTGDGDFRSDEVTALRDEADMVITNPPFSLFREFMVWLSEGDVLFSVIGNKNAITYKDVFPLIKDNKMWVGNRSMSDGFLFSLPKSSQYETLEGKPGSRYRIVDGEILGSAPAMWFTNIQHGRRNEPLKLMTQAENEKYNKRIISNPNSYKKYDNYDAIEVPTTSGIPSDYTGVTGVPISFLDKYCPEQFEIVKFRHGDDGKDLRIVTLGEKQVTPYFRILIRHTKPAAQDAIEAPAASGIPSDHSGVMGVPISFLDKYCPEQFEILGLTTGRSEFDEVSYPTKRYVNAVQHNTNGTTSNGSKVNTRATIVDENPTSTYYTADNQNKPMTIVYARILIRHINPATQEAAVPLAQVHTLETATPAPQQMAA